MSKYVRYQPSISRQSDASIDEDAWLKRFEKALQKDAVQPMRQESLFDQINSIMNGQSKFNSVEAAVEDMKARSGLTAYLDNLSKTSGDDKKKTKKTASDDNKVIDKKVSLEPIVMQKHPGIKKTLENYIRDTKGNLPVPAIIDKLRSIHQNDAPDPKDWDDDKLIVLVSKMNLTAKRDNPEAYQNYNNLGSRDIGNDGSDIDPSNSDAFFSLTPVKQ